MEITRIETFVLHVPVSGGAIADGVHGITHWGAPGVRIHTDRGLVGTGYTGTHAHLATDRAIVGCIEDAYGPLLIGRDPREVRALWQELARHGPIQWVGRAGIAHLALAAVDVALWDLKAQAVEAPLWHLLGGSGTKRVEAYDTDGGWLDRDDDTLVAEVERRVDEGYRAVKIKVGSPEGTRDLRRLERVRASIPAEVGLMVDANGRFDLPTAMALGRQLADFDVRWFEEPLWYDDVQGHARLADAIATPIALGEQLYTVDAFRDFIVAGAVHWVQVDAVRVAGITEWWQIAELAHAHRLPVAPHVGDMMQVHLQLAMAHPACRSLEAIPWMRDCFVEPATVEEGVFLPPERAGAGTALRPEALEAYDVR